MANPSKAEWLEEMLDNALHHQQQYTDEPIFDGYRMSTSFVGEPSFLIKTPNGARLTRREHIRTHFAALDIEAAAAAGAPAEALGPAPVSAPAAASQPPTPAPPQQPRRNIGGGRAVRKTAGSRSGAGGRHGCPGCNKQKGGHTWGKECKAMQTAVAVAEQWQISERILN